MRGIVIFVILSFLSFSLCVEAEADYCNNSAYRKYGTIISRMQELVSNSSTYAELISIGTTTEERTIQGLRITSPQAGVKAKILITGGIHAREWIGVEVAIGLAEYLIAKRADTTPVFESKNMTINKLLDNAEIFIVPVLNPDGYVYSTTSLLNSCLSYTNEPRSDECYDHDTHQLYSYWRKNRRVFPGGIGVDLNRNFDNQFEQNTQLDSGGDNQFAGPSAFSELETQAIKSLFEDNAFQAEIDFHSAARYVLYPKWNGVLGDLPVDRDFLRPDSKMPDDQVFKLVGGKIAEYISPNAPVMQSFYGTPARGLARDYFYANFNSAAFNIELDDEMQPDPSQLKNICTKNIDGPIWLMFWAADQGFRTRPVQHPVNY